LLNKAKAVSFYIKYMHFFWLIKPLYLLNHPDTIFLGRQHLITVWIFIRIVFSSVPFWYTCNHYAKVCWLHNSAIWTPFSSSNNWL